MDSKIQIPTHVTPFLISDYSPGPEHKGKTTRLLLELAFSSSKATSLSSTATQKI